MLRSSILAGAIGLLVISTAAHAETLVFVCTAYTNSDKAVYTVDTVKNTVANARDGVLHTYKATITPQFIEFLLADLKLKRPYHIDRATGVETDGAGGTTLRHCDKG